MNVQTAIAPTIDLSAVKGRQQIAWGSGDYAVVGTTLQIVGETLCEAVDLRSGQRVLDVAAGNGNAGAIAQWTTGELVAFLREHGIEDPRESKLSPVGLADLVGMVESRTLSRSAAKDVLAELTTNGGDPAAIVQARGLGAIADTGELEAIVERAIAANAAAVEQIRKGKSQAAGAIVGAVMKETKGRADGAEVNRIIKEKLGI